MGCSIIFDLLYWKGVLQYLRLPLRILHENRFYPAIQGSHVGIVPLPRASTPTTLGTIRMTTHKNEPVSVYALASTFPHFNRHDKRDASRYQCNSDSSPIIP